MVNVDYHIKLKCCFPLLILKSLILNSKLDTRQLGQNYSVSVRGNNFRIIVFLKKLYPSLC